MSGVKRAALDPLQQPELLDTPVSDLHLAQIASDIKNWEEVAPFLGLSDVEEEEIRKDYKEYSVQKRKALQRWREKKGSDATYRELRDALKRAEEGTTGSEWKQCRRHLIALSEQVRHPSFEQPPTLEISVYVDLSLVTLDGSDVRLNSVLRAEGRQVILIEGPPGSGKTTLTWRVYQLWAEGKLFQQFSLLIPISLSTPKTKMTCLADIIPYQSKKVREKVADTIAEKEGKGVCFVIDSWDEVPHSDEWQRSYLYNFVKGGVGYTLPHCSIVVTCRPAASNKLRTCATLKLRIAEFDALKIEEFVDRTMDTDSASRFLEILEEKPELYALCHLPLNITTAVYLYKTSSQELPTTRTKLYKALVHTQLARHWQLRTPGGDFVAGIDISNVMKFLPQEMLMEFIALCKLAYTGLRSGCSSFDPMALEDVGLNPTAPNTLSLMKSVKDIPTATKHSFLHFTIQEYLAAYHITQLEPEQQREAVEELLQISPLTMALPFYSGLTKLKNREVFKVLLKVLDKPLAPWLVIQHLVQHVHELGSDPRRLLVALMNCIYESEVHDLYKQIDPQMSPIGDVFAKQLSFNGLFLNPADCVSIGCFLRHTEKNMVVSSLMQCNITDTSFKVFMHQFIVGQKIQHNPYMHIYFNSNPMTHKGLLCLRSGLGNRNILLSLGGCLSVNVYSNNYRALKYLIECFSRSSGYAGLGLEWNSVTAEHKYYLLLLLQTKSLRLLQLNGNNLRGSMPLLAPALRQSNVVNLNLPFCGLDDNEIICLGQALQANTKLLMLDITGNDASSNTFCKFLVSIQHSAIRILGYDRITKAHNILLKAINNIRRDRDVYRYPIIIDSETNTVILDGFQDAWNMLHLPPEFLTGCDPSSTQ